MCVSRLQGSRGRMDLIRTSTRDCHNTSPQVLLLAVTQAICLSMNINDMICTASKVQISAGRQDGLCNVKSIYDEFWMALGATRSVEDAFHLPIPMHHKPLELIARHHRMRAVRRREYRDSVTDQAITTFCSLFINERRRPEVPITLPVRLFLRYPALTIRR